MNGMPNGERPERPNEQPPEKPDGDDRPKPPDGAAPPANFGGNMSASGEISTTFSITKGGNQFINVFPSSK